MGLVELGFPGNGSRRGPAAPYASLKRRRPAGQYRDHPGVSSIQPWNDTGREVLEVVSPVLPPDQASYRGIGRGSMRMKKYLQCAQWVGCWAALMQAALRT